MPKMVHYYLDCSYHGREAHCSQSHLDAWDHALNEALAADHIVIATPIYNFSLPTLLKTWFDAIVQRGKSWERNERGYQGLMAYRSITLLTSAAMDLSRKDLAKYDLFKPWSYAICRFLGFKSTHVALADAQAHPTLGPLRREAALRHIEALSQTDSHLRTS